MNYRKQQGALYETHAQDVSKTLVPPNNIPSGPVNRMAHMLHNFASSTRQTSQISQAIAGANERRRFIAFQNNGTATVFLAFGTQPNLNGANSFQLPPNGYLSFEYGICPNNEINAVSATPSTITIIEGMVV